MNIINLHEFKKEKNERAFKSEIKIMEEKVSQGIDGVEWLVLQVKTGDEDRENSLEALKKLCTRLKKADIQNIFKDALTMNHESFHEKHELNWWIVIDDALTYLASLEDNEYCEFLQSTYHK